MVVDHLVKHSDHFHLLLHLLLKLIQALQDLLDIDVHLIDLLPMTISSHPDLVDLVIMGLENATDFLGNRCQVTFQFIPLRR